MKQRIISGTLCVVVLALVLCFYNTLVLEAALSVLSAIAVYEMLKANALLEHKSFLYTSVVAAALMPYGARFSLNHIVIAAFVVAIVILMLKKHSSAPFSKIAISLVATLGIGLSFSSFILLRDKSNVAGLFYILVAFGSAWFADTGAYFTGVLFGKHKLCPNISPKKTIEGLIGGIVWNVGLLCLLALVYTKVYASLGTPLSVNYISISILAVATAFAGVAGDLVASVIKRQIGIKDYGNLIPGHGGIMDRFDSILFTAPTIYFVTLFTEIISK